MLKCTYRIYALSLAGGALLLGGASVAAGAMTLPKPSAVTEQATAAIVTDGAGAAKVEQIWWRGHRYGWHRGYCMAGLAMAGTAAGAGAVAGAAGPPVVLLAPLCLLLVRARRSPKARSARQALRVAPSGEAGSERSI